MLSDGGLGARRRWMFWSIFIFLPGFGVLFDNFNAHGTPVSSTERTVHVFSILSIVFEAAHQTL